MRPSSLTPAIPRPSPFHLANTQTPFLTSLKKTFWDDDAEKAAGVLAKATDADWTDLGDWACQFPDMDDKVRFLLQACKCMPHDQDKAAEVLINVMEELQQAPADVEHGPAALEHMLHASAHARWVDILAARPDLLARYCALLGKGPDAARAYCMLAKHLASKEDTAPYAWEVWQHGVKGLDGAMRLHITTHIRAIDRPIFNGKQHTLYRRLAPQVSDQSGFKTRLPTYRFVFPGTPSEQERWCEWALQAFVHNATRHLGRRVELKEFDGIRRARTIDGRPCIEVFYSTSVAQTVRHCMGVGLGKGRWPMEAEMQSMITQVRAEFARQWLDVTPLNITCGAGEILHERASRQQYAAVVQQLSAYNLLIGEYHDHFAGINFVVQNMRWLRQAGYTVLYLENMPAEAQGLANDFLSGKPMAPELALIHRSEFVTLLEKAREAGMRVVFIDTDLVRPLAHEDQTAYELTRGAPFHAFACDLIEDDAVLRGDGKFVALLGGHHLWKNHATTQGTVWGMQHRLPACKSLFLYDSTEAGSAAHFFIVSDEIKTLLNVDPNHLLSQVTADVYIAASQPTQMSFVDGRSDGVRARGVALPFEKPPGTPPR